MYFLNKFHKFDVYFLSRVAVNFGFVEFLTGNSVVVSFDNKNTAVDFVFDNCIVDDDTVVAEVENAALDLADEFGFLIAVDDNNTVAVVAQADDKSDVAAEIGNTALELAVDFGFLSVADDNNIADVVDYKGEVTVDNNNVEDIDHILVVENTALEIASIGSDYFAPGLVAGRIVDENIAYANDIDHLDDYQNHLSLI